MTTNKRIEKDSMGEMEVPDIALYGASTQRAVLNFPISGLKFPDIFIQSLGMIKLAAAKANLELNLIDSTKANAIIEVSKEIIEGNLFEQFPLDIFQTGSGTSTNMNANEVIANKATYYLKTTTGDNKKIHPNDDVNMCQSSNDVIPTTIHLSSLVALKETLLPALNDLYHSLKSKEVEFATIIKAGRTHLQDATPVTLGQEFGGYAAQIKYGIERINSTIPRVEELALGGTAVGTGINTHPEFAQTAIKHLNSIVKLRLDKKMKKSSNAVRDNELKISDLNLKEAPNHFEAQGSRDAIVELSGQLKVIACSLMKIANDIRWLSSGPRCGIGEIYLPAIQPGSSIMPAKVNPVICESVMMACAQVIGNDSCICVSGQHGNFELNVMLPVIGYNILQSIEILGNVISNFNSKCVQGIEPDIERCLSLAEKSLATCTTLAPKIGYDKAAEVAKLALKEDKTVRQVASELGVLPEKELNQTLDLFNMTKPGL